jgi:hypothetical protein
MDMHTDSLSAEYPKVLKAESAGNSPVGRPRFKWEEGGKEDAARLLRCCKWKLAMQNRTVWMQKLWEHKAQLQTVVS